jgi:hypothetical protein
MTKVVMTGRRMKSADIFTTQPKSFFFSTNNLLVCLFYSNNDFYYHNSIHAHLIFYLNPLYDYALSSEKVMAAELTQA